MINGKKLGQSIQTILSIALLTTGLLFILVPAIKTYLNRIQNDDIIEEFLHQSEQALCGIDSMEEESVEYFYIPPRLPVSNKTDSKNRSENEIDPENTTSPNNTPTSTPIPISTAFSKKSGMSKEEIQKRMTGVLVIPKINVKIVIMDGADEDTLRVAVGRLTYTDNFDEIGNCVLAGHRSYTFGKYLHRLNELDEGDKITVQTKEKTLNYTVYKSLIIEPDDFSILESNDTEKILTVFTCHPPGVGSHRLVVHAKQDE